MYFLSLKKQKRKQIIFYGKSEASPPDRNITGEMYSLGIPVLAIENRGPKSFKIMGNVMPSYIYVIIINYTENSWLK